MQQISYQSRMILPIYQMAASGRYRQHLKVDLLPHVLQRLSMQSYDDSTFRTSLLQRLRRCGGIADLRDQAWLGHIRLRPVSDNKEACRADGSTKGDWPMTLEYHPSLAEQPWPLTSVTPLKGSPNPSAVKGGVVHANDNGSFLFVEAHRNSFIERKHSQPLRGPSLRMVQA